MKKITREDVQCGPRKNKKQTSTQCPLGNKLLFFWGGGVHSGCTIKSLFGVYSFIGVFLLLSVTLQLNSQKILPSATFWISRGRSGCLPFSPPILTVIYIAHRVHPNCWAFILRIISNMANSGSSVFGLSTCRNKSLVIFHLRPRPQ